LVADHCRRLVVAAQPIADGRPVGVACLVGAAAAGVACNALVITTQLAALGRGGGVADWYGRGLRDEVSSNFSMNFLVTFRGTAPAPD
jgi:hypothetical protein